MHVNVQSALNSNKVTFKRHLHADFNMEIKSPVDFANVLGYDIKRITKSVFVSSANKEKYAIAVCSADKKLNFRILATALDCRKVEVASKEELQQLIGYPPNGVAPIGLNNIPVYVDIKLLDFESILTGAGTTGEEIEISPYDLQKISRGIVLTITV